MEINTEFLTDTNNLIEEFPQKSKEIIEVLSDLQPTINTLRHKSHLFEFESISLLNKLHDFLTNDDFIHLVKDQQFQLHSLQVNYSLALKEIAKLEEERENLSPKIQYIPINDENINKSQLPTIPLVDYDKLKEDYLKIFALNQLYEEKYSENDIKINSYTKNKEALKELTEYYEELKEIYAKEQKEYRERIQSLIKENGELRTEMKDFCSHVTLIEMEKKDIKSKVNKISQRNNTTLSRVKILEKTNATLKKHCINLKTKILKITNENEDKIDSLMQCVDELEEKNVTLKDEMKRITKDVFDNFIKEIEHENVSFHYVPSDNCITIYYDNELVGEVRNKSCNSIKRNHSNKALIKCDKFRLSDFPMINNPSVINNFERNKNKCLTGFNLRELYSGSSVTTSRRESSKSKGDHLKLHSWYSDNKITFTTSLGRLHEDSSTLLPEVTNFNSLLPIEPLKEEEEEKNHLCIINEESFTLLSNGTFIGNPRNHKTTFPKKNIVTDPSCYYQNNYIEVNHNHSEKGNIKQLIIRENAKTSKCFSCIIY